VTDRGDRRPASTPAAALFDRARFCHPWRSYQRRVLEALDSHLDDDRLHVVAAPGSGKTVLGLEVLRRLARPALALTPTRTIRSQWTDRMVNDFLSGEASDHLSSDLLSPGVLTVSTYQSVASLFSGGRSEELIRALRSRGVEVLAVDEAHHLRAFWWRCLTQLKEALPGLRVVALTATPPYDVSTAEWNRYVGFCGHIDEEISAPELVLEGNLCPHQDLLYVSTPSLEEAEVLRRFDREVEDLVSDLALDLDLARLLARHAALSDPKVHLAEILDAAGYYLSVAVFLHRLTWEAPRALLCEMGLAKVPLPAFDRDWAEVLLQGLLFDPVGAELRESGSADRLLESLRQRLADLGAIERRRVLLYTNRRHSRLLSSSPTKLKSVLEIVQLETETLGPLLRCVVLTDYIRARAFPGSGGLDRPFLRIGVVPIFETLRRVRLPDLQIGILTGSLIVIPVGSAEPLLDLAREEGLEHAVSMRPLDHDPGYLRVEPREHVRGRCVRWLTSLFSQGEIHVLVGTASLLGEGWDAPAVNTLVLASVIGSFVTSNQMRGRAIRADPGNETKTANIWHLVSLLPGSSCGRQDLDTVERRFRAFVGPVHGKKVIESGLERLSLDLDCRSEEQLGQINRAMTRRARERLHLITEWRDALLAPPERRRTLVRELQLDSRSFRPRFLARFPPSATHSWRARLEALWTRRQTRRIAVAVAHALSRAGLLALGFHARDLGVVSEAGTLRISLEQGSYLEQSRFVTHLQELFDPLADPRYLLRKGKRYWAVPRFFGENKGKAQLFHECWRSHAFRCELIFTRHLEGKLHLLRAKEQALLHRFELRAEARTRWG
jgi:superfamily II DNA or RNA helicase